MSVVQRHRTLPKKCAQREAQKELCAPKDRGRDEKMRSASRKPLRLRQLREERGFSQYSLAQQSGVGRSTIAALETAERGAHPSTMRALARALEVRVPDLYRDPIITPPPSQDRPEEGMGQSYERLREELRDAFPGIEYEANLERMAEQFVVEMGWLQERTFPLELAQPPRATLSARDLLELADSFYRYRMERWTQGEARGAAGRVRALGAMSSNAPLPN
jgi:transcriptional regulator with XRE-family HTH domain